MLGCATWQVLWYSKYLWGRFAANHKGITMMWMPTGWSKGKHTQQGLRFRTLLLVPGGRKCLTTGTE